CLRPQFFFRNRSGLSSIHWLLSFEHFTTQFLMESPTRMKKNQSEGFSSPKERYSRNPQKLSNTISTAGTDSPSRIAARNM
ncbi:MAG: hypothetical protein MHPSP_004493, partial [Paramarteilia canceri]